MQAGDIMTRQVITVEPDRPVKDVAKLLSQHGVSAVPVVDPAGGVIGMVSEGDLIGHRARERRERRSWWLNLLAEGYDLAPDYKAFLAAAGERAKDVMTSRVVSVDERTPIAAIADLLETHQIKRVPVLRDGKLVGIVSRANLVHALTSAGENALS
jgi:CBS domain-containing protein